MSKSKDISIYENGSGGEILIQNGDLTLSESLLQLVYLALFGGNVEQSTEAGGVEGIENLDWWGNSLLFNQNQTKWFNSETERTLKNTALNSQGRRTIEQAVINDLNFLSNLTETSVEVSILSDKKVSINVGLRKLQNQQDQNLQLLYDNAKDEVIINRKI